MRAFNRWHLAIPLAVGIVVAGAWAARYGAADDPASTASTRREIWTCPMHPEVQEHAPGKCPKCGMDLERAGASAAAVGAPAPEARATRAQVHLDTRRRQMLGVKTVTVERSDLARAIRSVGVVRYDETRLADVNLKLDGWARRLHVDATGQAVRRGQPLVEFYSPDLLASQNEYLLALSTRDTLRESRIAEARTQADRLVDAARQRLVLWDLPPEAIDDLERTRRADGTVTFRAPVTGYVIEKPVVEGMRVMAGQTLYRVADLSTVWVEADVFESDSPFIRTGAPATVTLDAWPGERWKGTALYVYPFVDEKARTLKVRFAFPNPRLRLKPGMYANVELSSSLGAGLTIPMDALLDTGRERLVFVAEGDGYYTPRTIEVGQRLGDRVQVLRGLEPGDEIASGASFFLDSESQLRAAAESWAPQDGAPANDGAPRATIAFSTNPSPPRNGENEIEVRVTGADGMPVDDAQVRAVFSMPAMPSMNMPAMSSEATLHHAGGGTYRGKGVVSMIGRWDVTVTATRDGRRVGSLQTTIVAR
jgi:RND family efflux transporter MFP subunit